MNPILLEEEKRKTDVAKAYQKTIENTRTVRTYI